MNYFTKAELLIILLDMSTYIQMNKILKESPSHRELRLKIQSLIDNYCEHNNLIQDSAMVDCCLDCNWSGFK